MKKRSVARIVEEPEEKTQNPDKEHFQKSLLKELVWKLDREVWAHVQNPTPNEEWSTSKAREVSRNLIAEYIGDYDRDVDDHKKRIAELEYDYGNCAKAFKEFVKISKKDSEVEDQEKNRILWKRAMEHSGSKMDPIKWLSDNFTITKKSSQ